MATQRRGARVIAADGAARRMRSAMSRARPEHDPRPPEARSPCRARITTRPLSCPHHGSAPVVPASRLGITTRPGKVAQLVCRRRGWGSRGLGVSESNKRQLVGKQFYSFSVSLITHVDSESPSPWTHACRETKRGQCYGAGLG